jgi:hypothetical protein
MSDIQTPLTAQPPPAAKSQAGKGCAGCLGLIILYALIGWIADMVGCNDSSKQAPASTTTDPNVRYVGANGAVFGQDQYGRTSRLEPGTSLRYAGG